MLLIFKQISFYYIELTLFYVIMSIWEKNMMPAKKSKIGTNQRSMLHLGNRRFQFQRLRKEN